MSSSTGQLVTIRPVCAPGWWCVVALFVLVFMVSLLVCWCSCCRRCGGVGSGMVFVSTLFIALAFRESESVLGLLKGLG